MKTSWAAFHWLEPVWAFLAPLLPPSPLMLCAVAAAVSAALLGVPPPADRLVERAKPPPVSRPPSAASRLLTGRVDAAPVVRRLLVGGLGAVGVVVALASMVPSLGAVGWLLGPPLGLIGAVMLGWLPSRSAVRRREALLLDGPQALELMAAGLAAGLPIRRACQAVVDAFTGPVAEDLGRVAALVELGSSDAVAWRALHDHPQFGPAADDLARSIESGTLVVEALRRHAAEARRARHAALQVKARAVGVRTVLPLMVCFIPSFLLLGVVPSVVSALQHAFG